MNRGTHCRQLALSATSRHCQVRIIASASRASDPARFYRHCVCTESPSQARSSKPLRQSRLDPARLATPEVPIHSTEPVMSESHQKMNVFQLTVITLVNMMGSGIILLPSKLAEIGTITIFSWLFTAGGSLALAYVFARCGML